MLQFIEQKENIVLSGAPGPGKTHLVTRLGRGALKKGYEVRFFSVADLVVFLEKSWREGKFDEFRRKYQTIPVFALN
ncbi:ATP-binding protein [Alkalibacterium pelagium]|uniref:ATP-binding protein n=1 Tax=Alkalibacterium pelagium TaxID=426702 RepID=UPI00358E63FA